MKSKNMHLIIEAVINGVVVEVADFFYYFQSKSNTAVIPAFFLEALK